MPVGLPPLGERVKEEEAVGVDEVEWEGLGVPIPTPGEKVAPAAPIVAVCTPTVGVETPLTDTLPVTACTELLATSDPLC